MDIAGGHVALRKGQRSQPYPNLLVSCQHETSFLSNQSDPAQNPTIARSLCKSKQSRPGEPGALRHPTHASAHVEIAKEGAGSQSHSSGGSAGLLCTRLPSRSTDSVFLIFGRAGF